MNELRRLLRYATPYRWRMLVALAAMLLYSAGSVGLAALIEPIFNHVLPAAEQVGRVAVLVVAAYFLKGVGGYVSGYLMADVGQRVVRDLRNGLFRHILGQSAAFIALPTAIITRANRKTSFSPPISLPSDDPIIAPITPETAKVAAHGHLTVPARQWPTRLAKALIATANALVPIATCGSLIPTT